MPPAEPERTPPSNKPPRTKSASPPFVLLAAAAVLGGGVALGGAAAVGALDTGSSTTVVEQTSSAAPPRFPRPGPGLTVNEIYKRMGPGVVQISLTVRPGPEAAGTVAGAALEVCSTTVVEEPVSSAPTAAAPPRATPPPSTAAAAASTNGREADFVRGGLFDGGVRSGPAGGIGVGAVGQLEVSIYLCYTGSVVNPRLVAVKHALRVDRSDTESAGPARLRGRCSRVVAGRGQDAYNLVPRLSGLSIVSVAARTLRARGRGASRACSSSTAAHRRAAARAGQPPASCSREHGRVEDRRQLADLADGERQLLLGPLQEAPPRVAAAGHQGRRDAVSAELISRCCAPSWRFPLEPPPLRRRGHARADRARRGAPRSSCLSSVASRTIVSSDLVVVDRHHPGLARSPRIVGGA